MRTPQNAKQITRLVGVAFNHIFDHSGWSLIDVS